MLKPMARRTLLLLWTFGVVACALLVMGVVSVLALRDRLEDRLDDDLTSDDNLAPWLSLVVESGFIDRFGAGDAEYAYVVYDADGNVTHSIARSTPDGPGPMPDLSEYDINELRAQ